MANNAIATTKYENSNILNDSLKITTTFSNNRTESCKSAIESMSGAYNVYIENSLAPSLTPEKQERIDNVTTSISNNIFKTFLVNNVTDIVITLILAKAAVTICTHNK